jgi:DNA polymerase elongation subunit (family B)
MYLKERRVHGKKMMNAAKQAGDKDQYEYWNAYQNAIKIAMNSIYGALGAANSWASCIFAARAITKYGQLSIKRVRKYVEEEAECWLDPKDPRADEFRAFTDELGNKMIVVDAKTGREKFNVLERIVVYGDTDSIMTKFVIPGLVKNRQLDVALAVQLNEALVKEINLGETLPDGTRRPFYVSPMRLAAEAACFPMIMTDTKKAYAGKVYTGTGPKDRKLKITGLANVRRDVPKYTRDVLNYLVALALAGRPIMDIYEAAKRCTARLLGGDVIMESEEEAFRRSEEEELERKRKTDERIAMLNAMTMEQKEEFLRKEKDAKDAREAEMIPDEPESLHMRDLENSTTLKKRYDPKLTTKRDGYYDAANFPMHVQVCLKWEASPVHKASVPKFGERVPSYFAIVPGAASIADQAVPPFMVRPGGIEGQPPLPLDMMRYFESKYKEPMLKLLKLLLPPEQVKHVLTPSNYRHSKRMNPETKEVLWTQPVVRADPVVRRQVRIDQVFAKRARGVDMEEI